MRDGRRRLRRRGRVTLAALALLVVLVAVAAPALAAEGSRFRPPVQSAGGIVATESPAAARVGRAVLARGGNAVDAAVASTFALGVARPQSCGIGGGGFMVYRSAGGRVAALDFREEAPAAVDARTFAGPGPHQQFTGHRTIGVPGTVAGMEAALERFGTVSLADAVAPAEELAREGFAVPQSLSREMELNADRLRNFPASAAQFLRENGTRPYAPGERLRQRRLAASLRAIARDGSDAFYRGEIARAIVADMRTAEAQLEGDVGLMTLEDLAAYRAVWREPLRGSYRGREVIAMPPPTSGGIAVLEMLNLLEGYDLRSLGQGSADALHFIAEAQKVAFADRGAFVADPDAVRVPTAQLTSKAYADVRRREIDRFRAGTYVPGDPFGFESPSARATGADFNDETNTTHLSVVDSTGNAVALTCTIEQSFGSAVVAPGTGILLNNELTDFSAPGTANEPAPGKRPRSSISPTLVVQKNRPVLAVGGAGGVRIIMGSLLAIVNLVDFEQDIAHAVDAERLDASGRTLSLEDARVPDAVIGDLARRGHVVVGTGEYDSRPRVQAAGIDLRTGRRVGVSDPRTEFATVGARGGARDAGRAFGKDTRGPALVLRAGVAGEVIELRYRAPDRGPAGTAGAAVQVREEGSEVFRALAAGDTEGEIDDGTLQATTRFRGRPGVAYEFRVRAFDRAGNVSRYASISRRLPRDTD